MAIQYGIRRGEAVVVAEESGELVGFVVWVAFPDAAEGEVLGAGTYVAPQFRRQLVSVEMREFAKDYCREKGRKYVSGAVFGENVAGLRAAKRTGARVRGYLVEWTL
jgi:GNAT superfamily N-acetyltransferase